MPMRRRGRGGAYGSRSPAGTAAPRRRAALLFACLLWRPEAAAASFEADPRRASAYPPLSRAAERGGWGLDDYDDLIPAFGRSDRLTGRPPQARSRARIVAPDDEEDDAVDGDLIRSGQDWADSSRGPWHSSVESALRLAIDLPNHPHSRTEPDRTGPFASLPPPTMTKTGTTIVGVYVAHATKPASGGGPDGSALVLAADTRATAGRLVADKRADKIHVLAPPAPGGTAVTAFACGAGTSADLDKLTRACRYTLQLQERQYRSIGQEADAPAGPAAAAPPPPSPVQFDTVCRFLQDELFRQGGACGANLIVGGASGGRCHLRAIHPHGSMDRIDTFAALGSGGLAAMAILESQYRGNMTKDEAVELAKRAILAGIENDLGSGSQVDICIIDSSGDAEHVRAAVVEEEYPAVMEGGERKLQDEPPRLAGVNGFGAVPFVIKSKRQITVHTDEFEDEWSRELGLK